MNLPQVGDVMHGKYRVLRVLGEGGMGCVFAATHLHLDEPVAIKILRPDSLVRPESVARFVREARTTMKLKSDHVVRVFDVDMMNGAIPFIVMELLEGRDLASIVSTQGAVEIGDAVHWVMQACEGIAEAHAFGIVHRDLKPANLFLSKTDCVKVLDFGVSKVSSTLEIGSTTVPEETTLSISKTSGSLRAVSLDRNLTQTNALLGSPQYMAPEQLRSARDADTRTDIWALGAILYELLTARPPFSASDSSELAERIRTSAPKRPREVRPSIPSALEAIVLKCLRKDPDERFADVADLAKALAPFGGKDAHESARRTHRTLHGDALASRSSWKWIGAAAFLACAIAIGFAAIPQSSPVPSTTLAPSITTAAVSFVSDSPPAIASSAPIVVANAPPMRAIPRASASVLAPRASASTVASERPKLDPAHAFDDPE